MVADDNWKNININFHLIEKIIMSIKYNILHN